MRDLTYKYLRKKQTEVANKNSDLIIDKYGDWSEYTSILPIDYEALGVVTRNGEPGALCYNRKQRRYARVNDGFITAYLNGYRVTAVLFPKRKKLLTEDIHISIDPALSEKAKQISPTGKIADGVRIALKAYKLS